ncbi:Gag-Pol polyprotein [Abeliophyllum distichum]|uniref:Gag-Pol polyprotein n=1 Tax=Abeliophyllum distichum TaxID=126358 RepID=A0ABD1PDK8_9LAMI
MLLASPDEQVNFVQNNTRQQYNPYSQTYNPGWRQHPNFKWSDNQNSQNPNNAPQERRPNLGKMFQQYMQKTNKLMERQEINYQNQQASIKKLETQIGQLALQLSDRTPGTLPSNTVTNPKEQVQVQAITTRSGVQLPETHVKRPEKKDTQILDDEGVEKQSVQPHEEDPKDSAESSRAQTQVPVKAYVPPISFSAATAKAQARHTIRKIS